MRQLSAQRWVCFNLNQKDSRSLIRLMMVGHSWTLDRSMLSILKNDAVEEDEADVEPSAMPAP
jgi:hypothetical protein